jgi:CheY-like chemotaxis protein
VQSCDGRVPDVAEYPANFGVLGSSGTAMPQRSRLAFQPMISSVNALIQAFASVLSGAAGSAIELRLGLADSVDRIEIDATQFKVALLNLVTNAREAMHGSGDLALSTRLVDDRVIAAPPLAPGLYAAICVSDSGCGISEQALDHVFEPFFSGPGPRHGAGLGLSQVYGFATQSRGGVGIETTEGKGTRVTIYLPLMAPATETSGGGGLGTDTGAPTVLLVDDDEHVRGSTSDAIEMLGYRVIAEATAGDALERLKREPDIDILFSDIVLPHGMSGVALAREARALRPQLRILLASGHARETLGAEGNDFADFAFLPKPYRLQELGAALKALGATNG